MGRGGWWLISVALVPGCSTEQRSLPGPARDAASVTTTAAPAEKAQALGYVAGRAAPVAAPAAVPAPDALANLKLIRTGHVTVEVADYRAAAARVEELARAHGGYVAGSQSDAAEGERRQGTLTVRVPAHRFDEVLGGVKAVGKVLTDKVDVQDVTKAYFDLETRLRVKRDTEGRLREILRTRTARLSDVLEAERELARVTEEIEGLEGARRFYDQQVAFATVVVSLQEPRSVVRPSSLAPVREALRESLRLMSLSVAALIYLVVFAAPWAAVLVPAWVAWRAVRRRRAARAATAGA
jgi:hypothetical protein